MSFQAKAVLESPRNSKVDNIDVRGGRSWQRGFERQRGSVLMHASRQLA